MITIQNNNDQSYAKAIVEVEFASMRGRSVHTRKGYVVFPLLKGNGTGDLLQATVHFCPKRYEYQGCRDTLLKKYYFNDPQNIVGIYVRSINVGPANMYYGARYGAGKTKGRASGSFVEFGPSKGTNARKFVIEGHSVKIAN